MTLEGPAAGQSPQRIPICSHRTRSEDNGIMAMIGRNAPSPRSATTAIRLRGPSHSPLETYSATRRIVWAHEHSYRPHVSLNR